MKILMISPFDLVAERPWGPTIRLLSLARELNRAGNRVTVAGPRPCGRPTPPLIAGVPAHYFRSPFHRYSYLAPEEIRQVRRSNRLYRLPLVMLSRLFELVQLVRRERFEVIYVNRACVDISWPALAASLALRVPIVCDWDDLEGLHGFSTAEAKPLWMQLFETVNECLFPRLARATVVASGYLHDFALKIGVAGDRLFLAPTFADQAMFHPGLEGGGVRRELGIEGKKVLFYCGNLSAGNGVRVENLLHTLAVLAGLDQDFVLLVVGDGDLLSARDGSSPLRELAGELGVAEKVIFTGGLPHDRVPRYLAAADLCLALFPVNVVTMCKSPLKIFEYLAAGKPVVARAVGEIARCLTEGENGFLVHSDDPQEYARAIASAFADPAALARVGANARRAVEQRFNWGIAAASVEAACRRALTCAS